MIVRILKTNWFLDEDPPEGTITFQTEDGSVFDAFAYGEDFSEGETAEVELDPLYFDFDLNVIFTHNPDKQQKLIKGGSDWSYLGYGRIISVKPVIIDFGSIVLDMGNTTIDEKSIGEYVYWKIARLDISKSETS